MYFAVFKGALFFLIVIPFIFTLVFCSCYIIRHQITFYEFKHIQFFFGNLSNNAIAIGENCTQNLLNLCFISSFYYRIFRALFSKPYFFFPVYLQVHKNGASTHCIHVIKTPYSHFSKSFCIFFYLEFFFGVCSSFNLNVSILQKLFSHLNISIDTKQK